MIFTPPTVVNVGYRSTNFYVVSAGRSRLLVDLGWPGTYGVGKRFASGVQERFTLGMVLSA